MPKQKTAETDSNTDATRASTETGTNDSADPIESTSTEEASAPEEPGTAETDPEAAPVQPETPSAEEAAELNPEAAPVQPASFGNSDSIKAVEEENEKRDSVPNSAQSYVDALHKGDIHDNTNKRTS